MYTEYNSQNTYKEVNIEDFENNSNSENNGSQKIFSIMWKIILVILIFVLTFLGLIRFGVISLKSSVSPEAILLNQNEIGIKKGGSYQLVSTILPENANNKQVVWSSSDPSIATVNEVSGYVKGIKNGTAVITVKTLINNKTNECIVNVGDKNVLITKININEKYISLAVGYSHSITYRTTPSNATELSLSFVSSDPSVAVVDSKGVIRGVKPGSAIITVSSNNGMVKDTTYVTVYKKGNTNVVSGESIATENYPKKIELSNSDLNLAKGTSSQLIAIVSPDGVNKKVSWSSSNSNVATVDSNGLIVARGVGNATIVAKTINGLTSTCKVSVADYSLKLKSINITTNYSRININSEKQLFVDFNPANASNKTVTWTSSDPNVVSVNQSGLVKAKSPGTAIITAKSNDGGYTDTATIEVTDYGNIINETGLTFENSNYSVGINQTISLNPTIVPSNATYKGIEFTSSNASVATVDSNGVVKGLSEGTTTITAITKKNKVKASVKVTVKMIKSVGVSLNNTNVSIKLNDTYTLVSNVNPDNATNRTVTYLSSNPNIAKVDNNGIITAVGIGTTTIIVTPNGGGNTSTCIVTVN